MRTLISLISLRARQKCSPEASGGGAVLIPRKKEEITLRLDADVIKWLRWLGEGYPVVVNMLLREFMDKHPAKLRKPKTKTSRKKVAA
jgi:uncharacterized protein (DUF4415 family)